MWYSDTCGLILGSLALRSYLSLQMCSLISLCFENIIDVIAIIWVCEVWLYQRRKRQVTSWENAFFCILAETDQILQAFPSVLCHSWQPESAASLHICNGEAKWYLLTLGHLPPESTLLHGWGARWVGCWPLARARLLPHAAALTSGLLQDGRGCCSYSLWVSLSFFWSLAFLPPRTSSPYRIDLKPRVSLSLTPPLRLTQEFPLFYPVSLCTSALFYPSLQNCLSVASSSQPVMSLTVCVEIIPPLLQDTVKLPEHRGNSKIHGQGIHNSFIL